LLVCVLLFLNGEKQKIGTSAQMILLNILFLYIYPSRWWLHLIVVSGFEYARDPESYTSGSVATGRVSLAGQVKG
jgi:hypothetical protein